MAPSLSPPRLTAAGGRGSSVVYLAHDYSFVRRLAWLNADTLAHGLDPVSLGFQTIEAGGHHLSRATCTFHRIIQDCAGHRYQVSLTIGPNVHYRY